MRAVRSAKFAEYASTYAILNNIGVHETALIERRDASVGLGVYVRDACDAGTTLLVVPSHRVCATSVMARIGTKVCFRRPAQLSALDEGLITFLTGSEDAATWGELCWRLALERHRSYSHWWGWLQSVPGEEEFASLAAGAKAQCRALHPPLYPFLSRAHKRLDEEKQSAHQQIAAENLAPSFTNFSWAVDVLISRGRRLPTCWLRDEKHATDSTELGMVPFVDFINGTDGIGRAANASIEIASGAEDLPEWYVQWILHEAQLRSRDGTTELARILEQRFCVCVSLTQPLRAAEEVILDYPLDPLTTHVLSSCQDEQLTRLLKFHY